TLWEQRPGVTAPDPAAVKTGAAPPAQHLEQRWYAGVHRDIGGGQPDSRQSDRTRLWVSQKAVEAGLVFKAGAFHELEGRVAADDPKDAPLGDTFRNLYRIIAPPYFRPIGDGVPPNQATYFGGLSHEVVDESVPARHRGDPEYHPAN